MYRQYYGTTSSNYQYQSTGVYNSQTRQSPSRNYPSNKLSELNQRLTDEIDLMKKRNQYKRQKKRQLRTSWGSADKGKASRYSNRSWDRKHHQHHAQRYQTDTQSLGTSRASTEILNKPVITHTNPISYLREPQQASGFRRRPEQPVYMEIQRQPILQYPVQQQYQVKNKNDARGKSYEESGRPGNFEQLGSGVLSRASSNQSGQFQQLQDPRNSQLPYFKIAQQSPSQPYLLQNYNNLKQSNSVMRSPIYRDQELESFLDMKVKKPSSVDSMNSEDFKDFDDQGLSPEDPYSPMTLVLQDNRSTPIPRPIQVHKSPMPSVTPSNKERLVERVKAILQKNMKDYDGKIFIFLMLGVGIVLVLFQLLR